MLVVDNFFPSQTIDSVINESDSYGWMFGRTDTGDDFYWSYLVYGCTYNRESKLSDVEEFKSCAVKECWEFFKTKFPLATDENLESCYLNGMTYGTEAFAHVDNINESEDFCTVVCYVCPFWHSQWSGETCFYSGYFSQNRADPIYYSQEVEKSVLPKYNRIVVFDGKDVHSVKPLSKSFKGLRKTLMFKIKNIKYEDLVNAHS